MDYAGEEVSLQALHAMLNQNESDKGKNPWMSFVDDLLAKGPSTQQWMSKLEELLRKMADELSSNNLGSATTMSLLGEAGEARKHFVEGLRAGLLKAFDVELQKFAVAVAGHVVQSKEDLPHAKEDVKALQQALQPFLQDKEAAKVSTSLTKWVKLNSNRLEMAGFQQSMLQYPKAGEHFGGRPPDDP